MEKGNRLLKPNYKGFYQRNGHKAEVAQVCQPHFNKQLPMRITALNSFQDSGSRFPPRRPPFPLLVTSKKAFVFQFSCLIKNCFEKKLLHLNQPRSQGLSSLAPLVVGTNGFVNKKDKNSCKRHRARGQR